MTTAPPLKSPWGMAGKLPPLGLAYVAAALEKNGFQVEIFDNYLLERPIGEVKAKIEKSSPEIVGITCSSLTYARCIEAAQAVKKACPSCKVIVGGPHPSYMPQTMLQHEAIDYVVIGEGEQTMVKLATCIVEGETDRVIAKIPGVACRLEGETVKSTPEFIEDLDSLPFPARHLLPMERYDRELSYLSVKPVDTMSIIRGCPYECAYCETRELWGSTCRAFSPKRVLDEMKHLVEHYGSKGIYFVGDNFTINKKRTADLCYLIRNNKLDLKWTCETRADLISKDLLVDMKSAGCQTIFFGLESGSLPIQQKLGKNIDLQEVEHTFRLCRQIGIRTATSFMLGIPGETVNDMKATFKFAKKLGADWCQFNIYVACPGSKLYDEVISQGLYDEMDNYLARVKTKDFDYNMLVKIQRQFQRDCQRSPSRLIRVIRQEGFGSAIKKGSKVIFHS
jgi:anaerobic magnesium-protoporphyrin IX monomethyl ester cyclase